MRFFHVHRVIEEIVEANRWRDGEFAKFKVNATQVDMDLWCRMCIPMIYAHWEGFVVSSMKILFEHLNNLKLKPTEVSTAFVVIGLGQTYQKLNGKQSFAQRVEFTDQFKQLYQNNLKFGKKSLNVKSNLKADVLRDICEMYSLEFKKFEEYTPDIDRLVEVRNSIAHGENSIRPDMNNIEKYITAVSKATDVLIQEIDNFLEKKLYLQTISSNCGDSLL